MEKFKIVISDSHLSAGRFYEGRLNPHEDFSFDEELCDLVEFFSTGRYGEGPDGPIDVELVINGDFLDFLNVSLDGEFEDAVTEEVSLRKLEAIFAGHPRVMDAIRRFTAKPGKSVTYLIGNHDADLAFPGVRERIIRGWDPEGRFPSEKVRIVHDRDKLVYEEGFEIHHGMQHEAGSVVDFANPLLDYHIGKPVLNLPWSSIFVLKIVNRLKWDREHLDKVRPIKVFVLFGLVLDPWFTVKFAALTAFYFIKTRFVFTRGSRLKTTLEMIKQETRLFLNLEREARAYMDRNPHLKAVLFGHTHYPMNKVYPDGRQYINTGTWTKMIHLDWRSLGQQIRLTFAIVHIRDGNVHCDLRQWVGEHSPHKGFIG